MSAILEPAGAASVPTAGVQIKGVTKQYQASGTGNAASTLETITPYDSGTILGHVQPGGAGAKLVNGTVQRASQLLCSTDPSGNFLAPVSGVGVVPAAPAGSTQTDGLSQYSARE